MKLSVIIVSYNVKFYLHQCLTAVERAARGLDVEVYVVDNGSSDGSAECVRKLHPAVHFIQNPENMGFARANNIAIRQSGGDYVLLLNPDTLIGEDTLRQCLAFMDSHADAGAVGVKMLNPDGSFARESRRGIPTPFTAFCKMSGLCRLFPKSRLFGRYYMQYLDRDEVNEIETVSGAFMMLRRRVLDEVGLLDEDYFMYGEDIDLSYRILKGGYRNFYLPVRILHYKGESTRKSSHRYVYVFYQAMLIFFRKHFGHYGLLISLPVKTAIVVKACLAFFYLKFCRLKDLGRDSLYYMRKRTYQLPDAEPAEREEAAAILRQHGIVQGKQEAEGGYVVVNAERTSYADLLRRMEQWHDGRQVATLFPSLHVLITASYIFKGK